MAHHSPDRSTIEGRVDAEIRRINRAIKATRQEGNYNNLVVLLMLREELEYIKTGVRVWE